MPPRFVPRWWKERPESKRADSAAALGAATYGYTELAQLAELACYCPGTLHEPRRPPRRARGMADRAGASVVGDVPPFPRATRRRSTRSLSSREESPTLGGHLRLFAPALTVTLKVGGTETASKQACPARRELVSEPRDELLDAVVVGPEGVFQKHRPLRLIVQFQVHPVHGEVAPALLRPSYELSA